MVSESADQVEKARHRDDIGRGGRVGRGRRRRRGDRRPKVFAKGHGRGKVSERGRRPFVAGGLGELLQQRGRGRVESDHGPDARLVAAHVAADGRDGGRHRDYHDHGHGQGAQLNGTETHLPSKVASHYVIL